MDMFEPCKYIKRRNIQTLTNDQRLVETLQNICETSKLIYEKNLEIIQDFIPSETNIKYISCK